MTKRYVFANETETKPSADIMKKYISTGQENKCFIGRDQEARIVKRDSVITTLSDPEALFDNCLYPLFKEGSIDAKGLLRRNLDAMASSDDVLSLFQAVRILFTQIEYEKTYDSLPFEVNVSEYLPTLSRCVEEKKYDMESHREGEFAKSRRNMYQQSINMLRKCEEIMSITPPLREMEGRYRNGQFGNN